MRPINGSVDWRVHLDALYASVCNRTQACTASPHNFGNKRKIHSAPQQWQRPLACCMRLPGPPCSCGAVQPTNEAATQHPSHDPCHYASHHQTPRGSMLEARCMADSHVAGWPCAAHHTSGGATSRVPFGRAGTQGGAHPSVPSARAVERHVAHGGGGGAASSGWCLQRAAGAGSKGVADSTCAAFPTTTAASSNSNTSRYHDY